MEWDSCRMEGVGWPRDATFWGGLSCCDKTLVASGSPGAHLRKNKSSATPTRHAFWPGTKPPGPTLLELLLLTSNLPWVSAANVHIPSSSTPRPRQLSLTYLLRLCTCLLSRSLSAKLLAILTLLPWLGMSFPFSTIQWDPGDLAQCLEMRTYDVCCQRFLKAHNT